MLRPLSQQPRAARWLRFSNLRLSGFGLQGCAGNCAAPPSSASSPIDPKLGPLANNGGPTLTHALLTGSPAIDAGNPATPGSGGNACAANDQRGYARPVDGDNNGSALCDVGAYEVGAFPATTIAYTYDPLYRLTGATYSNGNAFSYALDAVGNTLTRTQTLAGQLVTTTYTYDAANQLVTAKDNNDPTTWYYTYDPNGRLTQITPNGLTPANGARRFTYSVAGYLIQTETYTNTTYQLQAQMQYNALGERQTMIAWQSGISLTTQYVLDVAGNGRILAATANAQTTFYLYDARGPLAELTSSWAYYLRDGARTVRQVSDPVGAVTLTRSYTPWGEVLTQSGTGNFVWGYFGGLTDAVTGLIYIGGGQYYDPKTGRFLTRVVPFNPLRPRNPYVPTNDPLGALLGPIVLLVFLARRRKKNEKVDRVLLLLVVLAGVSLGLAACVPQPSPTPVPPLPTEPSTPPPSVPPKDTTTPLPPPTMPTETPTPTPTQPPTQTSTPCPEPPTPTPTRNPRAGDTALATYNLLVTTPGWWRTTSPDTGQPEVSLRTTLAITINYELNIYHRFSRIREAFIEAFARRYWFNCPQGCQVRNGVPDNGLLNFLGGNDSWNVRTPDTLNYTDYNIEGAYELADRAIQARSSDGDWRRGPVHDRPWAWGNLESTNPRWFQNWIRKGPIGKEPEQIYYSDGESFYIVTFGQQQTWCFNKSCVELDSADARPSWMPASYEDDP